MKLPRRYTLAAVAALVAVLAPGLVSAQSTWNLVPSGTGAACAQNATNTGNFGNSYACTSTGTAGTSVTARAFSTQNAAAVTGSIDNFQNVSGLQYANAYLSPQGTSGFGVANRVEGINVAAPDHSIDNNPTGSYDMVVLNFNAAVVLNQVGIGWSGNAAGSDLTIMRWTGTGAPTTTTTTPEVGGNGTLLRSGWTLVSSLADVIADGTSPYGGAARNTYADASQASSWWMIAAFNTTLNTGNVCYKDNARGTYTEGQTFNSQVRCDDGDDYFKLNYLSTVAATTPPTTGVPEPGSLALAGLALIGVFASRRKALKPV